MKAVIYGRVSTSDKGQDYDSQINEMDDWAKKNGYEVVGRFAEKITGVSKAMERTEFKKLLSFIEENNVKMILVSNLARIGRLGVKTRVEIETLAEKGVNIFFYDKNQYTLNHKNQVDSSIMMQIGIVLDIAKIEIDNTRNNIIRGLKNSARNGKIQGAKFKAYGFVGDENKNIKVVPHEQEIVKELFTMYDNGLPTTSIAGWLNTNKIPTRYNQFEGETFRGRTAESYTWSSRTVYRVLSNRMWIGERHHKGELVFKFEPSIDVDLFERVQNRLNNRTNRPARMITNTNHLKGIIYCTCGKGMYMCIDQTKRVNSYICLSKRYAKERKCEPCSNPAINIDKLLNSLFIVMTENFIKKMKGKDTTNFDEKIRLKNIELTNSENQIKKMKAKLNNILDTYNDIDDKGKRLMSRELYLSKKEEIESKLEVEQLTNSSLKNDVAGLLTIKNKPLKDYYTREQFLLEVKNIVKRVAISPATKKDTSLIKKTKTDIGIHVNVITNTDQHYNYVLSKYSNNYLFQGVIKPITETMFVAKVEKLNISVSKR